MPARLSKTVQHLNRVPEVLRCRRHTKQWLTLTSAYVGLRPSLPFEVTLPSGTFQFREISDVATFWQIFYRGIYPVDASDGLIIDAGANIGAFTLYALQAAPQARVVAIEPAPDSCSRVRSMLRAHHLESRCTLHEAALTGSAGETTIELNTGSQFRRSGRGGQRVVATTLDRVIPDEKTVDLLKMDIEGAEYEVLQSVAPETMGRIRRIVLEFHPDAPYQKATDPLVANGFELAVCRDDGEGYGVAWLEQNSRARELRASARGAG
jgi:FkbM family methyltransferase